NRANASVSPNGADATKPSTAISPIKANVQNLIKITSGPELLEKMKQTPSLLKTLLANLQYIETDLRNPQSAPAILGDNSLSQFS
ncbi:hypothetical protein EC988_005876, partial [Linderina pennispora]